MHSRSVSPRRPVELLLPRGLLLVAAFWMVASWLTSMGLSPPVMPTAASYIPSVRMMFLLVALGLFIGWPLLRLSGPATTRPVALVVLDLIVLLSLTQVVVWPLRLVTTWPPIRMLAVSMHLMAWTILIGAIVAWGIRGTRAWPRVAAMAACVALCGVGPAWWSFRAELGSGAPSWTGVASPLIELRALTVDGAVRSGVEFWIATAAAAVAGIIGLIGLAAISSRKRSQGPTAAIDGPNVAEKVALSDGEEPSEPVF
jgi:hypothetical protein